MRSIRPTYTGTDRSMYYIFNTLWLLLFEGEENENSPLERSNRMESLLCRDTSRKSVGRSSEQYARHDLRHPYTLDRGTSIPQRLSARRWCCPNYHTVCSYMFQIRRGALFCMQWTPVWRRSVQRPKRSMFNEWCQCVCVCVCVCVCLCSKQQLE